MFRISHLLKISRFHVAASYRYSRFKRIAIKGNIAVRSKSLSSWHVAKSFENLPLKRIGGTMVVGTLCTGGGDFIQQVFFEKQKLDIRRSLGFALMGVFIGGGGYYWYTMIDKVAFFASHALRQALLYQIVFVPVEYIMFYAMIGSAEGESTTQIKDEISKKLLLTYVADCFFYFPFVIMNVKFIPVHLRAAADCTFMFCWFTFLSYLKHLEMEEMSISERISKLYSYIKKE